MDEKDDILQLTKGTPEDVIERMKEKSIEVPSWDELVKEYDPKQHPVMDKAKYPDITEEDGDIDYVTRITQDLQRLAAKRTTELVFGIPVKRVYKTNGDETLITVSKAIEKILLRNRIDSLNIERGNLLYAGCEFATVWYATEQPNNLYGIESPLKLRCKSYSPMRGDAIYPLFDDDDDLVALSFEYTRKKGKTETKYFDIYTATERIRYVDDGGWQEEIRKPHTIGKIPGVYCFRETPAWEDTSDIVYEIEWALSRNGNYLRKNSKPFVALFADEEIETGNEKSEKKEFKSVFHYPKGSDLKYVTWEQAIENLKFYVSELRQGFFTQLQLPDMSYENMKSAPMSGESRKMMFVDSQLKVLDESGRLLEMLDREINVIKAFLKTMLPQNYHEAIDNLEVEIIITPFNIHDEKETISNITMATGGLPVMSQEEGVRQLGYVEDVEQEMEKLKAQTTQSLFPSYE